MVGRRKIVHKPILFYQSQTVCPAQGKQAAEWKKWDIEVDSAKKEKILINWAKRYNAKMVKLVGLPESISREQLENFERLWNSSPKKVMGLDNQLKNTRGLGYETESDGENSTRAYCNMAEISDQAEDTLDVEE